MVDSPAVKVPYWVSTVDYTRADESRGSTLSAYVDRETALAGAFESASYYLLECGYPSVKATCERFCGECNGDGEITLQRPRSTKRVPCKACKAHQGPLETIGPFPVAIHQNARHRAEACIG